MENKFSKEFFYGNRRKLCLALPDHLLVISAHSALQYSADISYPFRQDSNFWYLSGISEPDLLLLINTATNGSTLLIPERNDYQNEWDGAYNLKDLKNTSGVDEISFKSEFTQLLKTAVYNKQKIGYIPAPPERIEPYGFYANPSRSLLEKELREVCRDEDLVDIRLPIARLRQVKQSIEISAIKKAIAITGQTLKVVKGNLKNYTNEKEIERDLTVNFFKNGGDGHAYDPIVASGKNASTIHYLNNNKNLQESDLLLLDVGTKINGYAADISRTWSTNPKKTTKRQRELYQACMDIQEKGFSLLGPGILLKDFQKELEEYAQTIFKKLKCSMAGKQFPHGFSHFLGFDVHDAGDYMMPLQPGTVLTLEPGIYLQDEGIGIRIEDDVLITEKGIENLSKSIPKLL